MAGGNLTVMMLSSKNGGESSFPSVYTGIVGHGEGDVSLWALNLIREVGGHIRTDPSAIGRS